jgi:hypothetical protein
VALLRATAENDDPGFDKRLAKAGVYGEIDGNVYIGGGGGGIGDVDINGDSRPKARASYTVVSVDDHGGRSGISKNGGSSGGSGGSGGGTGSSVGGGDGMRGGNRLPIEHTSTRGAATSGGLLRAFVDFFLLEYSVRSATICSHETPHRHRFVFVIIFRRKSMSCNCSHGTPHRCLCYHFSSSINVVQL